MAGRDYHYGSRVRDSNNHASISTPIEDSRHRRRSPPPSTSRTHNHHHHHHQPNRAVEDRIAIYQRQIPTLRLENQRLLATHLALKHELSLTQKDLRQLVSAAEQVKTARDAEVRAVLGKTVKIEAEYRALEGLMAEVVEVRKKVSELTAAKEELGDRLRTVRGELEGLRPKLEELAEVKTEMESLAQDLQKGRAALDNERKTSISNNEFGRVMEKNISALRHEIDKLQAELANVEKKAAAAAAANPGAAYGAASYGNFIPGYGEGLYPNHYGVVQVQGGTSHNGQSSAIVTNGPPYGAAQVHRTKDPA